jgi:D-glycero-D-manno-heptose 1,7-bisphosphate phosphatase
MSGKLSPALFLDRDGVVNKDSGFVFQQDNFIFFKEIFPICELAHSRNVPIVVVTNQSGVGRGLFSLADFIKLNAWMLEEFKAKGILIKKVYFASHDPREVNPVESARRKPAPGMFFEAAQELDLDLSNSVMIGDKETDMEAAHAAGIQTRVIIGNSGVQSLATIKVVNHQECLAKLSSLSIFT